MNKNSSANPNNWNNRNTLVKCAQCDSYIDSIRSASLVWRVTLSEGGISYTDYRVVHDNTSCINNLFSNDHYLWIPITNCFQNGKLDFDVLFSRRHIDNYHKMDEASIKIVMPFLHRLLQRWYDHQEILEAIRKSAERSSEEKSKSHRRISEDHDHKIAEAKLREARIKAEKARIEKLEAEKIALKRAILFNTLLKKETERKFQENNANTKIKKRTGYVYLLQSPTGYYKIGRTKNPSDRIKTFNVKLPFEVEYVIVIPTSDMVKLETELHRKYAAKRVDGEWFELTTSDVAYIKGLAV